MIHELIRNTTLDHDPEQAEYFFRKHGWPVSFIQRSDVLLVPTTPGAKMECGDGRFDDCPGKNQFGPRVLGGINAVAAMLTGGDMNGFREATEMVKKMGFNPATHSADDNEDDKADEGGCGFVDLWRAGKLRSAIFPYELDLDSINSRGIKVGDWLSGLMETWGGSHYRLTGDHVEKAVRLNPVVGYTEAASDRSRFRIDDWFMAQLGVPARHRYLKIIETVNQLKPDAARLEIIVPK